MTQARGNKDIHTHYHLRLVKEIRQVDGKDRIITHQVRAQAGGREQMSRAERNCTGRAEQNYTTERRGVSIEVSWYLRA